MSIRSSVPHGLASLPISSSSCIANVAADVLLAPSCIPLALEPPSVDVRGSAGEETAELAADIAEGMNGRGLGRDGTPEGGGGADVGRLSSPILDVIVLCKSAVAS